MLLNRLERLCFKGQKKNTLSMERIYFIIIIILLGRIAPRAVSYTHLDVYKRQVLGGGGGDWRWSLNCCRCCLLLLSNSVFVLNCNWPLSMLLGCVLLSLFEVSSPRCVLCTHFIFFVN